MRFDTSGKIRLSASDLMRFQSCAHASQLDLAFLINPQSLTPTEDSEDADLIQAKGLSHEAEFHQALKKSGKIVTDIPTKTTFDASVEATLAAMRDASAYIYQGALGGTLWGGYADFLIKTDLPSKLGNHSYEVADTKLARSVSPKHILQLVLYSDLVEAVQGVAPVFAHLVLGSGRKEVIRLADYKYYARHARSRLDAFVSSPWETKPEPVAACPQCRWRDHCAEEWNRKDSLCLVAGITRSQRAKLEIAGVRTLTALGSACGPMPKLAPATFEKLKTQAALQHARRQGGPPAFKLKPIEAGRGLARLPAPDNGDLFFDMEGDPFYEDGLEYLFGLHGKEGGTAFFHVFWAHDRHEEAVATSKVLEFFASHLKAHPKAHIYHYNHYEVTALKRLVCSHGTGEAILDQLLRENRFVDLYRVVKAGLYASEAGYSIKDLEAFYMPKRAGEVDNAGASVVAYEKWRDTRDPAILDAIREYNRTDCVSTELLRNWLIQSARPADLPWFDPSRIESAKEADPEVQSRVEKAEADRRHWHDLAKAAEAHLGEQIAQLLANLAFFHEREDKPVWWAMFDRASRQTEDLIDDLDCLAGLTAAGASTASKRSQVRSYTFPPQETKLRAGARVKRRDELKDVTIDTLSLKDCIATVKFGPSAGSPPETLDLVPGGPIGSDILVSSLRRVLGAILGDQAGFKAAKDLVVRRAPRLADREPGALIRDESNLVAETVGIIAAMDETVLPIQGPPGTGKTYVSSATILALLKQGKRVAVSSNSHKAIDNLMLEVIKRAEEAAFSLSAARKVSSDEQGPDHPSIHIAKENSDPALATAPLVGGTAWLFSRDEHEQEFDYLFIDEAGQVSLANALAMARCARNLILVGDPMQLPQVIQGTHPGDAGLSGLEYLLKGHQTVPAAHGIFLPRSRRMHPAVCRYVSDLFYEGRLSSIAETERQVLTSHRKSWSLPPAGISFIAVDHKGNSQSSTEEAKVISNLVAELQQASFCDREGRHRNLKLNDIVIVAPYNAQVNLLSEELPDGARVGTVDRFQGQEAPVCVVSMATSSGDELPRDIEFLFSLNRINVAVSRAQALALVVASPALMDVICSSATQMRMLNAFCALSAYTTPDKVVDSPTHN